MRRFLACLLAALLFSARAGIGAPAKLDKAAIGNFIAEQGRAWNARDFGRFYGTFAPGAVIVLVTMQRGKEVARRVRTLAADRRQSEHFFAMARSKIHETDRVERIMLAPDGRYARVRVEEAVRILRDRRAKVLHAVTEQELELRNGRIVSLKLMEFDTR